MAGGPQAKISSGFRPFFKASSNSPVTLPGKPVLPSSVAMYIAIWPGRKNFSMGTSSFFEEAP